MANTFTRFTAKNVGSTPAVLVTAGSSTQTTVIGASLSNTTTSPITASMYITASSVNYYIVKDATIPVGGSLTLFGADGKLVLNTGDALTVASSASSSMDVIVSALQIT